jgi:hypothetical protein
MHLRTPVFTTVLAAALAAGVVGAPAGTAAADRGHVSASAGLRGTGASTPPTELMGDGPTPIPLKNMAMIQNTEWGIRYIAGQQDSRLTITYAAGVMTFVDLGTQKWRSVPKRCTTVEGVVQGVMATCTIPDKWAKGSFVQVWPRLGDDVVDGSTLPAQFRLWVLTDEGDDVVWAGPGDDFVNGAKGADSVHGGDGDDWLRTGKGDDVVWGDAGADKMVCQDGHDVATIDSGDRVYKCEETLSS